MIMRRVMWLLLAVSLSALSADQQTLLNAAQNAETKARLPPAAASAPLDTTIPLPTTPGSVVLDDPSTRASYLGAMRQYYAYMGAGYEYRSRVFEWQLWSSRAIFVIVVILVAAGVYFAAVQFHVTLALLKRRPPKAAPADTSAPQDTTASVPAALQGLATRIAGSEKGFEIESSVLGVVILALSLAFFYLYLVYVYPIKDVF